MCAAAPGVWRAFVVVSAVAMASNGIGLEIAGRRHTEKSNRLRGHILGTNMMCAFGVPGFITHGMPSAGTAVMPSDWAVAPGT